MEEMNRFYRTATAVVSRLNAGSGQGYSRDAEQENIKLVSDELKSIYQKAVHDAESAVIALYSQAGPHATGTHYAIAVRGLVKDPES